MLPGYLARLAVTTVGSITRGEAHPLDETRFALRVWPNDIDLYGHMNNGRYLMLMDIGRWDHGLRTGLVRTAARRGWKPVLGAATVRFRRELRALARFELATRISCWDHKWLFVEQSFEQGGEICAWAGVKVVFKSGRKTVSPQELLSAVGVEDPISPQPSPELGQWIRAQEPALHLVQ